MPANSELTPYLNECARDLVAQLESVVGTSDDFDSETIFKKIELAQSECLAKLAATDIWGKENQLPSGDFWKIAGQSIEKGPLQWHARAKPKGYAGDYDMLYRIANNLCGGGKLEQAFDRFFQLQAAPQAVRSRTRIVADTLKEIVRSSPSEDACVVSVGSGPAADVRLAAEELNREELSRLKVTLLDLDPHALDFAKTQLDAFEPLLDVRYERVNLYRIARNRRLADSLTNTDFVFCTGLFDYLSDDDAVQFLQFFQRLVADNGRMLVFNFEPSNPSRAYMEWFGNWYLTYRSEAAMRELAAAAQLANYEVLRDATGYDLYIDTKPSA